MTVTLLSQGGETITLAVEEKDLTRSWKRLQTLGLTPREAEILLWISEGKTNSEVAIIIGSRTRTVAKHLEHIFTKLGVETRTAAGVIAWEVLGSV